MASRIFLGYAVVLATFGAVSIFSVAEMHRNQVEIRLVSEGYLSLSQDAAAIETFHKNQERDTERLIDEKSVETRRALIPGAAYFLAHGPADRYGAQRPRRCWSSLPDPRPVRPRAEQAWGASQEYGQYELTAGAVFSG